MTSMALLCSELKVSCLSCKRRRDGFSLTDTEEKRCTVLCCKRNDSSRKKTTPLPWIKVFVVAMVLFANNIGSIMIFPMLPFMIQDFFPNLHRSELGSRAGYLGSAYFMGSFFGSLLWGWFADRFGRKSAMILGMAGTIFSIALFGTAQTFAWAILARFLWGMLNGNIGVAKTYLAEICDDTNQAQGFAALGLSAGLGRFLGSTIGGFLAQPADKYPLLELAFFCTFPYLLPGLVVLANAACTLVLAVVFLKETLTKRTKITDIFCQRRKQKYRVMEEASLVALEDFDSGAEISVNDTTDGDTNSNEDDGIAETDLDSIEPVETKGHHGYNASRSKLSFQSTDSGAVDIDDEVPLDIGQRQQLNGTCIADVTVTQHSTSRPSSLQFRNYAFSEDDEDDDEDDDSEDDDDDDDDGGDGRPLIYSLSDEPQNQPLSKISHNGDVSTSGQSSESDLKWVKWRGRRNSATKAVKTKLKDCRVVVAKKAKSVQQVLCDRRVILSVALYAVAGFLQVMLTELLPLLLVNSYENGGYYMDDNEIAVVITVSGVMQLVFQVFLYPRLAKCFGYRKLYRIFAAVFVVLAIIMPFSNQITGPINDPSIPSNTSMYNSTLYNSSLNTSAPTNASLPFCGHVYQDQQVHEDSVTRVPAVVWVVLCLQVGLQTTSSVGFFTSVMIMIGNSTLPENRGIVNGVAQSLVAMGRSVGPILASTVFAWTASNGKFWPINFHLMFDLIAVLSIGLIILSAFLPKSIEKKRQREEAS